MNKHKLIAGYNDEYSFIIKNPAINALLNSGEFHHHLIWSSAKFNQYVAKTLRLYGVSKEQYHTLPAYIKNIGEK